MVITSEMNSNVDTPDLPIEIIVHIMTFLPAPDRTSAGMVGRLWREAFLDGRFVERQALILRRRGSTDNVHEATDILLRSSRPFRHFVFEEVELESTATLWERYGPTLRSLILVRCDTGERTLVDVLKRCESLRALHIDGCRECLMSGRLLEDPEDVAILAEKFVELTELSLASNGYLSDALFDRLVAVCPNLESLSLTGCRISFHSGLYDKFYPASTDRASGCVLTFRNILRCAAKRAVHLKRLCLGSTLIDSAALTMLSTLDGLVLESLKLEACDQLTNVGIRALTEHQRRLKVLDVSFCARVTDASLLAVCENLTDLESLKLRRCRAVTDRGVRQIRLLRRLRELDVSECEQLTGRCVTEGLCDHPENESPSNDRLEKLYLNALNLDEKAVERVAMSFPQLRLLDIGHCFNAVTDETIQTVFKELTLLRSLKLTRCEKTSDAGLTGMGAGTRGTADETRNERPRFASAEQPPLRISLRSRAEEEIVRDAERKKEVTRMCEDLSDPLVDPSMVRSGYSLTRLQGLRELDLAGCNRITDVSLKYAFAFIELRTLDLSMCQQVTQAGLDVLTSNNPAIEDLNLSRCYNVTDAGVSYVTQRLRRLRVLRLQGCSQLSDHSLDLVKLYCESLRYLDVRSCRGMSIYGIRSLRVHVDYTKDGSDDIASRYGIPSTTPPLPPPLPQTT